MLILHLLHCSLVGFEEFSSSACIAYSSSTDSSGPLCRFLVLFLCMVPYCPIPWPTNCIFLSLLNHWFLCPHCNRTTAFCLGSHSTSWGHWKNDPTLLFCHLLRVTVLHCQLSKVWRQLFNVFLSNFLVFLVGEQAQSVTSSYLEVEVKCCVLITVIL